MILCLCSDNDTDSSLSGRETFPAISTCPRETKVVRFQYLNYKGFFGRFKTPADGNPSATNIDVSSLAPGMLHVDAPYSNIVGFQIGRLCGGITCMCNANSMNDPLRLRSRNCLPSYGHAGSFSVESHLASNQKTNDWMILRLRVCWFWLYQECRTAGAT